MFKIGTAIKTGLQLNGLQQNELAALVGVTEVYISYLKNDHMTASMRMAERMAGTFGVSFSEFISWGEE